MDETVDPQQHEHWPRNYFNYFTEIEEHFQRARGTSLFLLSPLDWALIETWKNAGVPLEGVLRGIDAAFDKWRSSKRTRIQQINGLAYCTQAVIEEAKRLANAEPETGPVEAPFTVSELEAYLKGNAEALRSNFAEIAATLDDLAANSATHIRDLEALEQRLTALEDKMLAIGRAGQRDEDLFEARRELDSHLRPYRSKMTADQLVLLEKQFLDRRLLEKLKAPRLSLFYLR